MHLGILVSRSRSFPYLLFCCFNVLVLFHVIVSLISCLCLSFSLLYLYNHILLLFIYVSLSLCLVKFIMSR